MLDINLIVRAKEGDEKAKEMVFEKNIKLIYHIVNRLNVDLEKYEKNDFFQIGTIGLIKALKNYDVNMDVKFSTFAFPYILGEIKMFLREDGIIKVSRNLKRINNQINDLKNKNDNESECECECECKCTLKLSDIQKATGASKEDIILAMNIPKTLSSINETDADEKNVAYRLKANDNVEEEIMQKVLLKEMLKKLEKDERMVIIKRYFYDMKQEAISKIMNITQVKVSRIEKRALQKLKILLS